MTPMSHSLDSAILTTLAYSAVFRYPLSLSQLWLRLLGHTSATLTDFFDAVARLERAGIISSVAPVVTLKNMNTFSVEERYNRISTATEKMATLQKLVRTAQLCPWIQAVGITGSVAVANAVPEDDIDIFIITQQNRLWVTRLYMEVITRILGTVRPREKEVPNSWCMNLWMESNATALQPNERSLYTAYEVVQVSWIYSEKQAARNFLRSNAWVLQVLPRSWNEAMRAACTESQPSVLYVFIFQLWAAVWFLPGFIGNYPAFILQKLYMNPHKSTEVVELSRAFFHPKPVPQTVARSIKNILRTVTQIGDYS